MYLLLEDRSGLAGQPKTNRLLKQLKVRTWFNAVSSASGKSAYQLEMEFAQVHINKSQFYKQRSRLWEKYRIGKTMPTIKSKEGGRRPIARLVEEKYPGTIQWLTHPIWDLANPESKLSMANIKQIFNSLPEELRSHFIDEPNPIYPYFWRKTHNNFEAFANSLAKSSSPYAFIALVCLYKESLICQNIGKFEVISNLMIDINHSNFDHEPITSREIARILAVVRHPFFPLK